MPACSNKWVLITGGSSGIGQALARLFSSEGANVAILARRQEVLEAAAADIRSRHISSDQRVETIQANVADLDTLLPALQDFCSRCGTPDILINSAGITYPGELHTLEYDTIRSLMEVNYLGTAYVTRAILPGMLERGSGHIVNISSMAGVIGTYGYSAYGASKFAIRGFSDVIRSEYKNKGIRVSVVFPPDTETPQLEFEENLKPAITRELSGNAGIMKADEVARVIWQDMQRGRYTIVPGKDSRTLYALATHVGDSIYPIMDMMVNNAAKAVAKKR